MWNFTLILAAFLLLPARPFMVPPEETAVMKDLWLDVSIGLPLTGWFNDFARPTDIARIENISQLNLLDQITIGRKLVVFKSVAEAETALPDIDQHLDIIGYNLEHGPKNPVDDQASPVLSAQRMRTLADEFNLTLAFGPDHDFALSHGVEIAPYVDIFVLQVQRAQTEPETVYDFLLPLIPQLKEANPDLQVSIQIRTEGDIYLLADLIASMENDLDGVSILTSPETVSVAQALVAELQNRMGIISESSPPPAESAVVETAPAVPADQRHFIQNGGWIILIAGFGILALLTFSRKLRRPG